MSACTPQPEPEIKTEEHWSDPVEQLENKRYYGCSKTRAELEAWK